MLQTNKFERYLTAIQTNKHVFYAINKTQTKALFGIYILESYIKRGFGIWNHIYRYISNLHTYWNHMYRYIYIHNHI